jgi:hypothetical protein
MEDIKMTTASNFRTIRAIPLLTAVCLTIFPVQAKYTGGREISEELQSVESRRLYNQGPHPAYDDYIKTHPYRQFCSQYLYRTLAKAESASPRVYAQSIEAERTFGVFVNAGLYDKISDSIGQYITDLESSGWSVVLYATDGGLPQDVKELIIQEYLEGMVGCILVGDIPIAWIEGEEDVWIEEDEEEVGDESQIDLYYGDLDGTWLDRDGDGIFDLHAAGEADRSPEIWLARLYATTLDGDEVELMKNYFRKNHAYREGSLSLPLRALDYADDDWAYRQTELTILYDDVTCVQDNQGTTAADYGSRLTEGYAFIRLWAHSGGPFHGFRDTPDQGAGYAHCYIHSPVSQQAQLRFGSEGGIKVWLNGANIHTNDVYRLHVFDEDVVNASLSEGWNRLLIKVSDDYGGCGFSARLSNLDGNDIDNLIFQLDNPLTHGLEPPFIRVWLVNGFYTRDRNWYRCLDYDYLGGEDCVDAVEGQVNGDYTWTKVSTPTAYVDLNTAYPPCEDVDEGTSYAFARVYSPITQVAELRLGSSDSVKVWLNGQIVHSLNELRAWNLDDDKIQVTLRAGWNRLLIKVVEWHGEHGFSARFAYPDGTAILGLQYDPAPEPTRYIRDWLCNGWYTNWSDDTRLSEDYLGDETSVTPTEGERAGTREWIAYRSLDDYIDLNRGAFAATSTRFYHDDLIAIDPCCFFYDLWCCGTRMCNRKNYLGGWYVFANSYGLATWGLLHPQKAFYLTLAERKCLGEAQLVLSESFCYRRFLRPGRSVCHVRRSYTRTRDSSDSTSYIRGCQCNRQQ